MVESLSHNLVVERHRPQSTRNMAQYWPLTSLLRHGPLRERLIVSLDMIDRFEALRLVDKLVKTAGMFKVGRTLFRSGGPDFIREIRRRGGEVFLDLKFGDTQQKAMRAAIEATRLGVRMFDIHARGCVQQMARMRAEIARVCRAEGLRRPHILAIAMLARCGVDSLTTSTDDCVARLARLAADAGLDGAFTPAHEVQRIRTACGRRFIIVACGIQPLDATGTLALTAAEAVRAGADYLVIGSPILRVTEPVQAIRAIAEDIDRGLRAISRGPSEMFSPRPV